jgi:hypothetical protein
MNKSTVHRIAEWRKILTAMAAYEAELPEIGPWQAELEEAIEEVTVCLARRIDLERRRKQATRDLHEATAGGTELVRRLQNLVKAHFGSKDERLAAFGIKSAWRRIRRPPPEPGNKNGPPGFH